MKVLILYAKAGGGHKTMANILAQELKNKHEIIVEDVFENSHNFFHKNLGALYSFITQKTFFIWWLLIKILRITYLERVIFKIFLATSEPLIDSLIKEHNPEIVISTYYYFSEIISHVNPKIKTWTVVSDILSPETIWFTDTNCEYIVFSDKSSQIALQTKIKNDKIHQILPVISQGFLQKIKLLQNVHSVNNTTQNTILLLGGGEGLKNAYQIAKYLLQNPKNLVHIVCGRDPKLFKKMVILSGYYSNLKVFGFVDFVSDLIYKSNCVVTKAGPNSVLEILSLQKPVFICDYIWPQESGILDFVVSHNYGVFEPNPKKLAGKIETFLYSKNSPGFDKVDLEFGNHLLSDLF